MVPSELVAVLSPGSVINGKYRVDRPLGVGGMGVVLAARHLDLNQAVAIKVLLPSAATNAEATTRFLREGRSAAQLTSPHVAKVHDTGRLPTGEPYLVMELLHGQDLRVHLAEVGRVPLAQATEWILQAAHALAEAHAHSIIHRDVKPANLFLAETSTGQQLKVLDFGISKQIDSVEALTNTMSAVGTPRYMSPEQMRSPRFADARGDVWSLGIVLYELTTGQPPFQGESITALCFDVMERTPAPPSSLNPSLPPAFDAFMDRCLEKDPSERFQSMQALAVALRAIVPGSQNTALFNVGSLRAPASVPVPGLTPIPTVPTPDPASSTRVDAPTALLPHPPTVTFPLAHHVLPEVPPHETMQSWNTSTVPAHPEKGSVARKSQRLRLIALGIGIGLAVATPVMLLLANREPSTPNLASSAAVTPPTTASMSVTPVETVIVLVNPPAPSISPSSSVSSAPSALSASAEPSVAPLSLPPPDPCSQPFTIDKKGHKKPKPWCL